MGGARTGVVKLKTPEDKEKNWIMRMHGRMDDMTQGRERIRVERMMATLVPSDLQILNSSSPSLTGLDLSGFRWIPSDAPS